MALLEHKQRPVKYLSIDNTPMDKRIELSQRQNDPAYTVEKSFLPFDPGRIIGEEHRR
eukprot:CAMPEP_0201529842 /NCGR_PEP_ID=MMETSP0161_2-20130828/42979_1 /ASSEMBLY_ACC=CAM_ASM_000251 /TAXON_ID=180227 /ORGANISM="Neoparamoeba aestuarina, Strain SoJaBio B1-5/56/2" /LENGTH=57 /DNA_ID=CAMNT_0047931869 /DNA_START=570 /DNA_END=743 /DNA_ORIENTATION=-